MDADRARLAISLVDLTDLRDDCDAAAVESLCDRAVEHGTAAVCVWPDFVKLAARRLAGTHVRVATVVNFPTGNERAHAVRLITAAALADGGDEIDVVLPYGWLERDRRRVDEVLRCVREETADEATMKVILETGELVEASLIADAARIAIDHGADFIKTSTGKTPVSATLDAAEIMLQVIAHAGRPVGIKPSGGISSAADADRYLRLAESVMGEGWLTPSTFRFGASGLLAALVAALDGQSDDAGRTGADPVAY